MDVLGREAKVYDLSPESHSDGLIVIFGCQITEKFGEAPRFVHLDVSSDGKLLAAADRMGRVFAADRISDKFWLAFEAEGPVSCLKLNPANSAMALLIFANANVKYICLRSPKTVKQLEPKQPPVGVFEGSFNLDGTRMLLCGKRELALYNTTDFGIVGSMCLNKEVDFDIVYGSLLPSSMIVRYLDNGSLVLWDAATFEASHEFALDAEFKRVAISRNCDQITIAGSDPVLYVFDVVSGSMVKRISLAENGALAAGIKSFAYVDCLPSLEKCLMVLFNDGSMQLIDISNTHSDVIADCSSFRSARYGGFCCSLQSSTIALLNMDGFIELYDLSIVLSLVTTRTEPLPGAESGSTEVKSLKPAEVSDGLENNSKKAEGRPVAQKRVSIKMPSGSGAVERSSIAVSSGDSLTNRMLSARNLQSSIRFDDDHLHGEMKPVPFRAKAAMRTAKSVENLSQEPKHVGLRSVQSLEDISRPSSKTSCTRSHGTGKAAGAKPCKKGSGFSGRQITSSNPPAVTGKSRPRVQKHHPKSPDGRAKTASNLRSREFVKPSSVPSRIARNEGVTDKRATPKSKSFHDNHPASQAVYKDALPITGDADGIGATVSQKPSESASGEPGALKQEGEDELDRTLGQSEEELPVRDGEGTRTRRKESVPPSRVEPGIDGDLPYGYSWKFDETAKASYARHQLRSYLNEFGQLPSRYRVFLWETVLLSLPRNRGEFKSLVRRGLHPAVGKTVGKGVVCVNENSSKIFKRVLSAFYHWTPSLVDVEFFPHLVIPFVEVFRGSGLCAFEAVLSLLFNWCSNWFHHVPFPPLDPLIMVQNIIQREDRSLCAHFEELGAGPLHYAWPLLSKLFVSVLTKAEWVRLWDHILCNHPSFLIIAAAAYNIVNRGAILTCGNLRELEVFFHNENAVDMSRWISETFRLLVNLPDDVNPKRCIKSFAPLIKGGYPLFTGISSPIQGLSSLAGCGEQTQIRTNVEVQRTAIMEEHAQMEQERKLMNNLLAQDAEIAWVETHRRQAVLRERNANDKEVMRLLEEREHLEKARVKHSREMEEAHLTGMIFRNTHKAQLHAHDRENQKQRDRHHHLRGYDVRHLESKSSMAPTNQIVNATTDDQHRQQSQDWSLSVWPRFPASEMTDSDVSNFNDEINLVTRQMQAVFDRDASRGYVEATPSGDGDLLKALSSAWNHRKRTVVAYRTAHSTAVSDLNVGRTVDRVHPTKLAKSPTKLVHSPKAKLHWK